jgi:hypothetical protein
LLDGSVYSPNLVGVKEIIKEDEPWMAVCPGLMILNLLTWKPQREYHFNSFRGSKEAGGAQVPVSGTLVLGGSFFPSSRQIQFSLFLQFKASWKPNSTGAGLALALFFCAALRREHAVRTWI